jgi:hypothetical protein
MMNLPVMGGVNGTGNVTVTTIVTVTTTVVSRDDRRDIVNDRRVHPEIGGLQVQGTLKIECPLKSNMSAW